MSCQVMADMKKMYSDLIIINLYLHIACFPDRLYVTFYAIDTGIVSSTQAKL